MSNKTGAAINLELFEESFPEELPAQQQSRGRRIDLVRRTPESRRISEIRRVPLFEKSPSPENFITSERATFQVIAPDGRVVIQFLA
jgi:hypothetical protein